MFITAFPDMTSEPTFLAAESDLVGIPATGNKVEFAEIHIVRMKDGKAVEHWGLSDGQTMMQQLGVTPLAKILHHLWVTVRERGQGSALRI